MSNKFYLVLSVLLTGTMLLAACASATPIQPTTAPTAAALPDGSSIKVGLVTNTGGVNDQAFNQLAWVGIQKASTDMGFESKFLESKQPADYEMNIDALATEGYNVIITVGSPMSDVTALKAKQYPHIKFAIIDHAYSDGGLSNVTSLMFAEDEVGFLAGALAGGMSQTGFVCSVSSMRTPQSDRYMLSFFQGATWQAVGTDLRIMNNYINIETTDENVPTIDDSTQGKETAQRLINEGCDVIFGIGDDSVNGALLAAKENNLPAVGINIDQYNTNPEIQSALITSAMKNVDIAVYNFLKSVTDGSVTAGISIANLQNGGVGLAPFHDWEDRISSDLRAQIQKAGDGLKDGSIQIDLP